MSSNKLLYQLVNDIKKKKWYSHFYYQWPSAVWKRSGKFFSLSLIILIFTFDFKYYEKQTKNSFVILLYIFSIYLTAGLWY